MNTQAILSGCATIVVLSVIAAIAIVNISERNAMAKNITEAIEKGIDPLSVRCSYAYSHDMICVAHASSNKK